MVCPLTDALMPQINVSELKVPLYFPRGNAEKNCDEI